MEKTVIFLASSWLLKGSVVYGLHCNNSIPDDPSAPTFNAKPCPIPGGNDVNGGVMSEFNSTGYFALIAAASVFLPIIVFVRIFWLKKLQRERAGIVNRARRELLEEQRQGRYLPDIFTIDIDGNSYEDIYGKPPPRYEDSMSKLDFYNPPPYDLNPPSYLSVFPGDSVNDNEVPSCSSQSVSVTPELSRQNP
ncbi:hypothetical protein ACF0H5_015027 [Mactra antiquata]